MKMFIVVFALVSLVCSRPAADNQESGTDSTEDSNGSFFRPRFGKRSAAVEDLEVAINSVKDNTGFIFKHKGKRSMNEELAVEASTETSEDGNGFFFRPKFDFGKRSAEIETVAESTPGNIAFVLKHKGKRSAERIVEDLEVGTDSSEDGNGFFFRPKFGKRSVTDEGHEFGSVSTVTDDKHRGKRSLIDGAQEAGTEAIEDGYGFFFRPKFGKRSTA